MPKPRPLTAQQIYLMNMLRRGFRIEARQYATNEGHIIGQDKYRLKSPGVDGVPLETVSYSTIGSMREKGVIICEDVVKTVKIYKGQMKVYSCVVKLVKKGK
jgi:hypothetical protein